MWGYLKDVVLRASVANLVELKVRISQHIMNIIPETLRSVIEHAVCRFQLFAHNGGQHVVLRQSRVLNFDE